MTNKKIKMRSWKITFGNQTQLYIGKHAPKIEEVPYIKQIRGLKLSQVIIDEII